MAAPRPRSRPLPPATRRFVGWLLLLAGGLLALGVLLQMAVAAYMSENRGFDALGWRRLGVLALGLGAATALAYAGRQLRHGGGKE